VGSCATARRVRNHSGFTLIELMLVVSIIGILATIAIPGLMRARQSGNEASAVGSMRTIGSAQTVFSSTCGGGGFAVDLGDLGLPPLAGGGGFIPPDLNEAFPGGTPKSGYEFTVSPAMGDVVMVSTDTCNGAANDTETAFFANGDPISSGTGARHFGTNESAHIRQGSDPIADITDGGPLQ
jgi:type IV pilus assembly protein PilA